MTIIAPTVELRCLLRHNSPCSVSCCLKVNCMYFSCYSRVNCMYVCTVFVEMFVRSSPLLEDQTFNPACIN